MYIYYSIFLNNLKLIYNSSIHSIVLARIQSLVNTRALLSQVATILIEIKNISKAFKTFPLFLYREIQYQIENN
jgi:hypothetical protein